MEEAEERIRIKGIFSKRPKKHDTPGPKKYWFAKEVADGRMSLQMLNDQFVPAGKIELLERPDFFKQYVLEPDLWYKLVTQRVARGDSYREASQYFEAKIEYNAVTGVDQDNIRAMFGLGLCYLALEETDNASVAFQRLVEIDETFAEEHKHLFNEFGIALRKKGMFEQAVNYYRRAMVLSPKDDNLLVNAARSLLENGQIQETFEYLRRALALAPANPAALSMLGYLKQSGHRPENDECRQALEPFLAQAELKAKKFKPEALSIRGAAGPKADDEKSKK